MRRVPDFVDHFAARAVFALSLLLAACSSQPPACADHFAGGTVSLTQAQLSMLLEGIDWRRPERTQHPSSGL